MHSFQYAVNEIIAHREDICGKDDLRAAWKVIFVAIYPLYVTIVTAL